MRRPPSFAFLSSFFAIGALVLAVSPSLAEPSPDLGFAKIKAGLDAQQLTREQALLLELQHVFDIDAVPPRYKEEGLFLTCATPLVLEYHQNRDGYAADTRAMIDGYLTRGGEASKATYVSGSGRFELTYTTSGAHGVPATDASPANGTPDYVENVASTLR